MKINVKCIVFTLLLITGISGLSAQDFLSANDLKSGKILETTVFDGFTIFAKSEKAVDIEAIDPARTAADGEVFNMRIKLNGGGAVDFRAVGFSAKAKQKIIVYLNSSSKTDARILKLVAEDGTVISELSAPPDDGLVAGIAEFTVTASGKYAVFSAGSGINLYQIIIE